MRPVGRKEAGRPGVDRAAGVGEADEACLHEGLAILRAEAGLVEPDRWRRNGETVALLTFVTHACDYRQVTEDELRFEIGGPIVLGRLGRDQVPGTISDRVELREIRECEPFFVEGRCRIILGVTREYVEYRARATCRQIGQVEGVDADQRDIVGSQQVRVEQCEIAVGPGNSQIALAGHVARVGHIANRLTLARIVFPAEFDIFEEAERRVVTRLELADVGFRRAVDRVRDSREQVILARIADQGEPFCGQRWKRQSVGAGDEAPGDHPLRLRRIIVWGGPQRCRVDQVFKIGEAVSQQRDGRVAALLPCLGIAELVLELPAADIGIATKADRIGGELLIGRTKGDAGAQRAQSRAAAHLAIQFGDRHVETGGQEADRGA